MSQALIGLLGAVVGATAATSTAVLIEWRRSRDEDRRWLRSQLEEAYAAVVLNLLRWEGIRSEMGVGAAGRLETILKKDDMRRWFDALIDARSSLQKVIALCSEASHDELVDADAQLERAASRLLGGEIGAGKKSEEAALFPVSAEVRRVVVACARRDLRGEAPVSK